FDYRRAIFAYLGLTLKYRWLIMVCFIVALAIGFVITFTTTPIYRATVSIQIDRQAPKIVRTDTPDADYGDTYRYYQTQYDLLRSRMLAERVASDLNLASESGFVNPPSSSAWKKLRSLILPSANTKAGSKDEGSAGSLEQRKAAAVGMVQGGLSIEPIPNSNLLKISFDSPSAEWAARIANGVADSYVTSNFYRRSGAPAYAPTF